MGHAESDLLRYSRYSAAIQRLQRLRCSSVAAVQAVQLKLVIYALRPGSVPSPCHFCVRCAQELHAGTSSLLSWLASDAREDCMQIAGIVRSSADDELKKKK